MEHKDIYKWVKSNIEPFKHSLHGKRYRCAARLNDGLFLPCVTVCSAKSQTKLAIRRFDETRKDKTLHKSVGYQSIVRNFVTSGNRLNHYDISELIVSDYAISPSRIAEIGGETSMGWTEFYATMDDGKEFCFATSFHVEFFSMPEGYKAANVNKIKPAVRGESRRCGPVCRERPFFECYIDNL